MESKCVIIDWQKKIIDHRLKDYYENSNDLEDLNNVRKLNL